MRAVKPFKGQGEVAKVRAKADWLDARSCTAVCETLQVRGTGEVPRQDKSIYRCRHSGKSIEAVGRR